VAARAPDGRGGNRQQPKRWGQQFWWQRPALAWPQRQPRKLPSRQRL